ncbi:MAG: hypothetical protein QF922_03370, partial [SAR324 cluster bacterium]|nr:hypothetical protein [SAR324 cluster bacterium]
MAARLQAHERGGSGWASVTRRKSDCIEQCGNPEYFQGVTQTESRIKSVMTQELMTDEFRLFGNSRGRHSTDILSEFRISG